MLSLLMQDDISSRVFDSNTDSEEFVKETYAPLSTKSEIQLVVFQENLWKYRMKEEAYVIKLTVV